MTTSGTASNVPLIMYGLFTSPGVDHQAARGNVDTFVIAGGTLKVRHSNLSGPVTVNAKACLLTIHGHGTYTIMGGTGKYKGISGHGTYKINILDIQPKTKRGACNQNAAPIAFQQVINATGPVKRH